MDRTRPSLMVFGVAGSLAVVVLLAGCATSAKPYDTPPLPRMEPRSPEAPKPVLTAAEAAPIAARQLAADEFDALLATLAPLPAADRAAILGDLLAPVAQKDPWRAGRIALALPEGDLQKTALDIAAPAMIARDADATIRWVFAAPSVSARFVAGRALVELWVQRDPKAALDHLLAQPESLERNHLLSLLAAYWTRKDPTAALAAVRAVPNGKARTQALTSVVYQMAVTQPARAVEAANLVPEGPERYRLYSAIGQTWVAVDADAAWKWANALPSGDARLAAANGIQTGLGAAGYRPFADDGMPLALASVGSGTGSYALLSVPSTPAPRDSYGLPVGIGREEAVKRRFEEMLQQSPRRAAEWIGQLPTTDRNDDIMRRLTREWYLSDPQGVRDWLEFNVPSVTQRRIILEEARR